MQKTAPYLLLFLLFISACMHDSKREGEVTKETDTIYHKKTVVVYETETVRVVKQPVILEQNDTPAVKTIPQEKIQVKKRNPAPKPAPVLKLSTDTEYHYYTNKKISVKISPWKNDERSIQLFDMDGNISYTFKDIRHSYSTITELRYYANGAVSLAITHLNPGASMYWNETETKFTETNIPLTQQTTQFPLEGIRPPDIKYWDPKKKEWVKQLTIECQPTPVKK